jgi:hypothetical protein
MLQVKKAKDKKNCNKNTNSNLKRKLVRIKIRNLKRLSVVQINNVIFFDDLLFYYRK